MRGMLADVAKCGFEGAGEFMDRERSLEGWYQRSPWLLGCAGAALVKE